jgi:hypothetical protein
VAPRGELLFSHDARSTNDGTCGTTDNNCAIADDSSAAGGGEYILHDNNVDLLRLPVHRHIHLGRHLAHYAYSLTYLLPGHHQHQRLCPSYRLRGR